MSWVVAGSVGGAVGAAVGAGVTYSTHRGIGWIAWGVGAVTGLAVRMAAKESVGLGPGVVAVLIALPAVGAGKFAAVHLAVESAFGGAAARTATVSDEDATVKVGDEVVDEYAAKKAELTWPAGVNGKDDASEAKDYPEVVWAEARKRWQAKPQAERDAVKAEMAREREQIVRALKGAARDSVFRASFSPFDLLWAFLAVATAFRLGPGMTSS